MAAGGHFGCPKITSGRISGHFRPIRNLFFIFFTKWLPSAILDVRNSLWITFLAILDIDFLFFLKVFYKMAAGGHFGCPKNTFDLFLSISHRYATLIVFEIFWQNGWRRPFWMLDVRISLSIAFLAISDRYQLNFFLKFLTKWLPSAILDVRNSLWITFLAILDQNRFCIFFIFFFQNGCRWPFWMSETHFRSHLYPFHIDMQL